MRIHNLEVRAFARNWTLWLLVALIRTVVVSAQQDSMKACSLLTPAELGAAIGGSVGHPMGIFTPKNLRFDLNGDFWSCEQTVGTRKVWIFFNTLQVTEEGKRLGREQEDRFRKQGYQIKEKELSGSHCSTIARPAGLKDDLHVAGTSCSRDKRPYHIMLNVRATGPNDLVSMEKVASLTEKAALRAPAR